ncbi:uncharacterized protein LOC116165003 [Photinus pyralis]|uniref:THAP-type domain-containing protein n=2 Tax=Photinus pyralis TaxID=7054 RepID=A0A1Y1M810_PHOPY|nr:uncharacterized protein LOC116165003 [Photinus pyralis]XP_031335131.1 uncharacterized protein LOC116165003 [Photinus pyralis]
MLCLICGERSSTESAISFHGFPKDSNRRKLWLEAFRLPDNTSTYAKVCSKHFTVNDYQVDRIIDRRTLTRTAVPTQNLRRVVKAHKMFNSIQQLTFNQTIQQKPTIITENAAEQSNCNLLLNCVGDVLKYETFTEFAVDGTANDHKDIIKQDCSVDSSEMINDQSTLKISKFDEEDNAAQEVSYRSGHHT